MLHLIIFEIHIFIRSSTLIEKDTVYQNNVMIKTTKIDRLGKPTKRGGGVKAESFRKNYFFLNLFYFNDFTILIEIILSVGKVGVFGRFVAIFGKKMSGENCQNPFWLF